MPKTTWSSVRFTPAAHDFLRALADWLYISGRTSRLSMAQSVEMLARAYRPPLDDHPVAEKLREAHKKFLSETAP